MSDRTGHPTQRPLPWRRRTVAALGVAVALVLAGCGTSREIRIGISLDEPGLGMRTGNGYSGFDVDVARYVAARLGYSSDEIRFVQVHSADREGLVRTGQVTLVVATYSITDWRTRSVSFAGPYFLAGQGLLVRTDTTDVTGPASLSGHTVCTARGSTSASRVKSMVAGVVLQEDATYTQCVDSLVAGSVDAVTTDDVILAGYASDPRYKGKVRVVGRTFSQERYGIAFTSGDTALCTKVTDAIRAMISDGSWQRFATSSFGPRGFRPDPGNPPTPDACP